MTDAALHAQLSDASAVDLEPRRHLAAALGRELRLEKFIKLALQDLEEGNAERAKLALKEALQTKTTTVGGGRE